MTNGVFGLNHFRRAGPALRAALTAVRQCPIARCSAISATSPACRLPVRERTQTGQEGRRLRPQPRRHPPLLHVPFQFPKTPPIRGIDKMSPSDPRDSSGDKSLLHIPNAAFVASPQSFSRQLMCQQSSLTPCDPFRGFDLRPRVQRARNVELQNGKFRV